MFTQYIETFDKVIEEAKKSEHIIQSSYFPIYKAIEDYVRDNKLILSNVETLIKKEKSTFRT